MAIKGGHASLRVPTPSPKREGSSWKSGRSINAIQLSPSFSLQHCPPSLQYGPLSLAPPRKWKKVGVGAAWEEPRSRHVLSLHAFALQQQVYLSFDPTSALLPSYATRCGNIGEEMSLRYLIAINVFRFGYLIAINVFCLGYLIAINEILMLLLFFIVFYHLNMLFIYFNVFFGLLTDSRPQDKIFLTQPVLPAKRQSTVLNVDIPGS